MHPQIQPAFIIADHRRCLRNALQSLLAGTYTHCTIKEAADTDELLHIACTHLSDVVFIDHSLPTLGGFEAFEQLTAKNPACAVILFGSDSDKKKVTEALMNGAAAFFSWHDDPVHILHTVHEVLHHGFCLSAEQMQVIRSIEKQRKQLSKLPQRTRREKEELTLLAQGYSTKQIAAALHIGYSTAENYRNSLLRKTGTRNTIQLLNFAKQAGWLNDETE